MLYHLFFRIDVGLLFRNDVGVFFFFFCGLVLLQFIYLFSDFSSQFLAIKNLRIFLIFSEGVPNFFFMGRQIKNFKILYINFFFQVRVVLGPPWRERSAAPASRKIPTKHSVLLICHI